MKKNLIIVCLFSFLMGYAQTLKKFNYTTLSNPDIKNELSLYFKKEIPKKLLKNIKYPKNKTSINAYFYINKENKPYDIKTNLYSNNKDLEEKIKEAFDKYPLEKLNIKNLNSKNRYSFQIISNNGNKNIFNCSSKIIIETPTVCSACKDLNYFEDFETCLNRELKKHFYKNFNFSNAEKSSIKFNFFINRGGNLIVKKSKKTINNIDEIKNVLTTFPKITSLGSINNKFHTPTYSFYLKFKKNEKNIYVDPNTSFDSFSKPNVNNTLSKYLISKITPTTLKKANLNRINNRLMIYFNIDKNNNLVEIRTSARSKKLDNKLKEALKEYPFKNLNLLNTNKFNNYILQAIAFENNTNIIKASSYVFFERIPIFPGCKTSSNSIIELKKCFSKKVQEHFVQNFDADLPNKLDLTPGRKRIFIGFTLNKEGNASDIKIKAPHIAIKKEVKRVIEQLPKSEPGIQNDKPVNIKYSIPFTLIVK